MSGTFNVSYNAGGNVDKIKKVENIDLLATVGMVEEIGVIEGIKGFASKTQPYNKMYKIDIPAGVELIENEFILLDKETEILSITVTCTGYGEEDYYNLWFNDNIWFDTWYCQEVKEGLFLGSSTYVYLAPPSSKIRISFNNLSNTSKTLWLGVRMLVDKDEQQTE